MAMTVRDLAKGPALGDMLERMRKQRRILLYVFAGLALAFILVGIYAPLVGLLLLAVLLMVGVAITIYSRKQAYGLGRNVHGRGERR